MESFKIHALTENPSIFDQKLDVDVVKGSKAVSCSKRAFCQEIEEAVNQLRPSSCSRLNYQHTPWVHVPWVVQDDCCVCTQTQTHTHTHW